MKKRITVTPDYPDFEKITKCKCEKALVWTKSPAGRNFWYCEACKLYFHIVKKIEGDGS